ncbi:MAG: 5'/3'-nucleotidase SurE [Gemmatimonadetes bacterium RBG_16_66_8]|nr:MAG: 5'/3'-nucleotidase SurE [Gemmatimonadetes bacterium RBG_16_66_8]
MRILVANDDGFDAPGLAALVDSLRPLGRIFVAAPREQQSGTGHGITYRDPLMVRRVLNDDSLPWFAVSATPATTVRLALEQLMDSLPDLVVSGINTGENIGLSAWLSGTVAAAREAAFLRLPAIAVSLEGSDLVDFHAAAGFTRRFIERLRNEGRLRAPLLLNVNVPAGVAGVLPVVRVTRLSLVRSSQRYDRRTTPNGQLYFWDNWQAPTEDVEGTDLYAFMHGSISVTPLSIDQTAADQMAGLKSLERP